MASSFLSKELRVSTANLRYLKSHEWIRVEGNLGVVGISDHAQKEITDVVYVELPKVGKAVQAMGEATTLESVKAAFSIYAPVSGTITKVNQNLEGNPGLVNQSPFGDGWIYAIEMTNPSEVDALMTESQYHEFLKSPEAAGHH
jgi:glycine cleavage system H protein